VAAERRRPAPEDVADPGVPEDGDQPRAHAGDEKDQALFDSFQIR